VDPWIIALVAVSAVLHLAWNVRLKTAGDPLRTATIGLLASSLVIAPVAVVAWWAGGARPLPPEGIALGLASGVVEAAYFIFLAGAYRRGDLSVVYPVARGTAPLLAVVIGVVLFGERLGPAGSLGVVCLIAGFLMLQRPWRAVGMARRGGGTGERGLRDSAILYALATGVMIATYTAIDRLGTRLIEPVPYAAILWVSGSLILVGWVGLADGGGLFRDGPAASRHAVGGGFLTLGAYLCILVALSVAPLSGVAPLRESATVFAAAWGSVRMGEASDPREAARRIGASVLIVGGALLLAAGS
jgi:drug/metabolite transporter (DMT)-like permease